MRLTSRLKRLDRRVEALEAALLPREKDELIAAWVPAEPIPPGEEIYLYKEERTPIGWWRWYMTRPKTKCKQESENE